MNHMETPTPQTATIEQIKWWLNEVEADEAPDDVFIPNWPVTEETLKAAIQHHLSETVNVDELMKSTDAALSFVAELLGEALPDCLIVLNPYKISSGPPESRQGWFVAVAPWNNADEAYWAGHAVDWRIALFALIMCIVCYPEAGWGDKHTFTARMNP